MTADRPRIDRTLDLVHVFPDLLSTYGDSGNIRTLVARAERRDIRVTVTRVLRDSVTVPAADLYVIGGGQDRDQLQVETALARLASALEARISDGAALLAVCGGYQNLGLSYRFADGRTLHGPGIFAARTVAGTDRLVGPVVARLSPEVAIRIGDGSTPSRTTVVGFENHSGRTDLASPADAFATVEVGGGNNGMDATEGSISAATSPGLRQLRIGTYLHGPLLPRNPHIADALIRAGLARTRQPVDLEPLDDELDWRAHDRFVETSRRDSWFERLPAGVRRVIGPARDAMQW